MTRTEALHALELPETATPADVERAYEILYTDFQIRLDNAPTDRLRVRLRERLRQVGQAYAALQNGAGGANGAEHEYLPGSGPVRGGGSGAEETRTLLRLRSAEACTVTVDMKRTIELAGGGETRIEVVPGAHLVEALTGDGRRWEFDGWIHEGRTATLEVAFPPAEPQPPTAALAALLVRSDEDCVLHTEGDAFEGAPKRLRAGTARRLELPPGVCQLRAVTEDGRDWADVMNLEAGRQQIARVTFEAAPVPPARPPEVPAGVDGGVKARFFAVNALVLAPIVLFGGIAATASSAIFLALPVLYYFALQLSARGYPRIARSRTWRERVREYLKAVPLIAGLTLVLAVSVADDPVSAATAAAVPGLVMAVALVSLAFLAHHLLRDSLNLSEPEPTDPWSARHEVGRRRFVLLTALPAALAGLLAGLASSAVSIDDTGDGLSMLYSVGLALTAAGVAWLAYPPIATARSRRARILFYIGATVAVSLAATLGMGVYFLTDPAEVSTLERMAAGLALQLAGGLFLLPLLLAGHWTLRGFLALSPSSSPHAPSAVSGVAVR